MPKWVEPKAALEGLCEGDKVVAKMKDGSRRTLTAGSIVSFQGDDDGWLGFHWRRREVLNGDIESVRVNT